MDDYHELDVKICCGVLLSYPTVYNLIQYAKSKRQNEIKDQQTKTSPTTTTKSPPLTTITTTTTTTTDLSNTLFDDLCRNDLSIMCDDLLQNISVFESVKCCIQCQHRCVVCPKGENECRYNVGCLKYACAVCGKECNMCVYSEIKSSIIIIKLFHEIVKTHREFFYFQQFDEMKYVFQEFPFCTTWEMLWNRLNNATLVCLTFLKKASTISSAMKKDRKMDMRIVLKKPKHQLLCIYGEELNKMSFLRGVESTQTMSPSIIRNNGKGFPLRERLSSLSEKELHKDWTFDELHDLIVHKDFPKLKDIFHVNPNLLNIHDGDNSTITLFEVAIYNDDASFRFLLTQTGINCRFDQLADYLGRTKYNEIYLDCVKLLVENCFLWLHLLDEEWNSVLHYMCQHGNVSVVEYLLQQPTINVDIRNKDGRLADELTCEEIIKTMISEYRHNKDNIRDMGMGDNIRDMGEYHMGYENGIHHESNEEQILNHIAQKQHVASKTVFDENNNVITTSETTPTISTITETHNQQASLIQKDLNYQWTLNDIWKLLLLKELSKLKEIFRVYPKLINSRDINGRTLLHIAIIHNYSPSITTFLIQEGIDCNVADNTGNTAYHYAAGRPKVSMEYLIKNKVDGVNVLNNDWNSPLHLVCYAESVEKILCLLQQKDVKIDVKNKAGKTPEEMTNNEIIKQIFSKYRAKNIKGSRQRACNNNGFH